MNENNNLLKLERHGQIQNLVIDQGRVTVQELSSLFGVSDATIRRDLEELANQGQILRTHGGACGRVGSSGIPRRPRHSQHRPAGDRAC